MIGDTMTFWSGLASGFSTVGFWVAAKSALLLTAAFGAHILLGRRRVLVRSAVWNACLIGLVVLPLAEVLSPRLGIETPRRLGWGAMSSRGKVEDFPAAASAGTDRLETEQFLEADTDRRPMGLATARREAPGLDVSGGRTQSAAPGLEHARSRVNVWGLAFVFYLLVVSLILVRLAFSLVMVSRLRRSSRLVANASLIERLKRWRRWLGIDGHVILAESSELAVPITAGWRRPVIILPKAMAKECGSRLADAVLLHELCHIQRSDYAWNLVRNVVQAFYWPQPLVWLAESVIRGIREQACDLVCVGALGGQLVYRTALVEVAAGLLAGRESSGLTLGMAMARSGRLERRLKRLERSEGIGDCLMRPWRRWTLFATLAIVGALLGSIDAKPAHAVASPEPTMVQAQPTAASQTPPANSKTLPAGALAGTFGLTVLDASTGKPIEGATVMVWAGSPKKEFMAALEGRVQIPVSSDSSSNLVTMDIWKDGYVQQRFAWGQGFDDGPLPGLFTVKLVPGDLTVGGLVNDEAGQPVAGALVEIWGYLKEKKDPHELCYLVRSKTDAQGRWRNRSLREMTFIYLLLSHPDFQSDGESHPRRFGDPADRDRKPPAPELARLRDQTDVQVLKRGFALRGRVLDETGRPIAGASVGWTELDQTLDAVLPNEKTTGADGSFAYGDLWPGRLAFIAKAPGHGPGDVKVTIGPDTAAIELRLGPARVLEGRVVDHEGRPIDQASIRVDTWREYRCLGVQFLTDRDGRFRWSDAPSEAVLINVQKPGYLHLRSQRAAAGERDIKFSLTPGLMIQGRVTDAETRKSLDGHVSVELGLIDPKSDEVSKWLTDQRSVNADEGRLYANINATLAPAFKLRISALGYEPQVSRKFLANELHGRFDVSLKKLRTDQGGTSGVVLLPDGRPLAGAQVVLAVPESWVSVKGGKIAENSPGLTALSGPDGRFAFPIVAPKYEVLAATDLFVGLATGSELEKTHEIKVRPWARIEGQVRVGAHAGAGHHVDVSSQGPFSSADPAIVVSDKMKTDSDGRFAVDHVLPGYTQLSYGTEENLARGLRRGNRVVLVKPGETMKVTLGGRGRPVIGRVVPPSEFGRQLDFSKDRFRFRIESNVPLHYTPLESLKTIETFNKRFAHGRTPEQWAYRDQYVQVNLRATRDGSFRCEDLPAGTYRLSVSFRGRDPAEFTASSGRRLFSLEHVFRVPEMPGARSDVPLDLGTVTLPLGGPKELVEGDQAPSFEVSTLDGKPLELADYRGRLVLLNFWAPWNAQSLFQIPYLKEVARAFPGDRLAIITLITDIDPAESRRLAAETGMPGVLGFLGQLSTSAVVKEYGVAFVPRTFLIGPDGVILVSSRQNPTRLWMTQFREEVARALGQK